MAYSDCRLYALNNKLNLFKKRLILLRLNLDQSKEGADQNFKFTTLKPDFPYFIRHVLCQLL